MTLKQSPNSSETTSELGETKPKRYSKHLERVMRAAATFR